MSEMPDALNQFRFQLEEWLELKDIKFQARNVKIALDPKTDWARLSILNVGSNNACLGNKWIRDRGIFVVSMFFQLGEGSRDADDICYELRDHFSEWQYNYLETGAGSVEEVPTTQDFYHVNINLPYRHK